MKVEQARETARQWVVEEASGIPGFCGAYTAGSTNWLPDNVDLAPTSDFDIMVVLTDPNQASRRGKFMYRQLLLEASYLGDDQFRSPEVVLSDYHLAPSFRTANLLLDPSGQLATLRTKVCRDYAKRSWVRQRCANARERVLEHFRSNNAGTPLHDQVLACLFGAGVTTHILLVAGLRNPTVRARYVAARELLADYDQLEFHETLLELLGAARMSHGRASQHLATLTVIFGAATNAIKMPFPFASSRKSVGRLLEGLLVSGKLAQHAHADMTAARFDQPLARGIALRLLRFARYEQAHHPIVPPPHFLRVPRSFERTLAEARTSCARGRTLFVSVENRRKAAVPERDFRTT